jgi:hypothetical protein
VKNGGIMVMAAGAVGAEKENHWMVQTGKYEDILD